MELRSSRLKLWHEEKLRKKAEADAAIAAEILRKNEEKERKTRKQTITKKVRFVIYHCFCCIDKLQSVTKRRNIL
jgi:hypothetical protein